MKRVAWVALLGLLLGLPWWVGGVYYVNLASQVLIAALFAMSLNLLVGYAGLTSLGHAGYLGLSAYTSGWLMVNLGWGHLASAGAALAGTVLMAALFGLIALRATGISFLMITLALGQILWGLAYRWTTVTGGDNGISGLTRPSPFGLDLGEANTFYFFTLLVFVLVWGVIAVWVGSPFGASIRGTKDQPRRMSALGYNVWLIRWITFIVSGFFGAVAGLMYVYYHQFISPHSLSLANSAEMLLMVIAGGAGTLSGPIVGAALVVLLKNVASAYLDRWVTLLGLVFIFIVMYVPGGIVAGLGRWTQAIKNLKAAGAASVDSANAAKPVESAR
jgi:branched-chain amino acid transport system permease protein